MAASSPDNKKAEKFVSVIGPNYVERIVPDLFVKAHEYAVKREYSKKTFRVNFLETTYATAAVVLTVLATESYRNSTCYLSNKKIGKSPVTDLVDLINGKLHAFDKTSFRSLLTEVFILRDVIVHNHLYEVNVSYDEDSEMVGHRQKLVPGYGKDYKFKKDVNSQTRKTKRLKMNVPPHKIGLAELFKVLLVFDLLITILRKSFGDGYAPFRLHHRIDDAYCNNLSEFLAYYYERIPDPALKQTLKGLIDQLRQEYTSYIDDEVIVAGQGHTLPGRCVLNNECPKCGAFGFRKPGNLWRCAACQFAIPSAHSPGKSDAALTS